MQRDRYNAVTDLPILIPAQSGRVDGAASWEDRFGLFHPVRRLKHDDAKAILKSLDKDDLRRWKGLVTLRDAIQSPDALLTEKLVQAYKPLLRDIASRYVTELKLPVKREDVEAVARFLTHNRRDTATAILSQLLTAELLRAKLVVWRTPSGWLPAIYCDDSRTALFVYAAVSGQLAICPHCDSVFVKARPDQRYCKVSCREAHRVARWRKGKSAKRRKDGTSQETR
jgi:hypothetical protein